MRLSKRLAKLLGDQHNMSLCALLHFRRLMRGTWGRRLACSCVDAAWRVYDGERQHCRRAYLRWCNGEKPDAGQ